SRLPYRQAGLTQRQAAAHLLDRFAFGARPGDIDRAVAMGLDRWLDGQLSGTIPDPELQARLSGYPALSMSDDEIVATYPDAGQLRRMAVRDGAISASD